MKRERMHKKRAKWRAKRKKKRTQKTRMIAPAAVPMPLEIDYDDLDSIRAMARAWFIGHPDDDKDNKERRHVTTPGELKQLFVEHQTEFVLHTIQLSPVEQNAFRNAQTYPTYGECDLNDIEHLLYKYNLTAATTDRKVLMDMGSGRGLVATALFMFQTQHDVVGCELSLQRFQSCYRWLQVINTTVANGKWFLRMKPNDENVMVLVRPPLGQVLMVRQGNFLTSVPRPLLGSTKWMLFNVHVPVQELLNDLKSFFSSMTGDAVILAYTRKEYPLDFLVLQGNEIVRTDWAPSGFPFKVYKAVTVIGSNVTGHANRSLVGQLTTTESSSHRNCSLV